MAWTEWTANCGACMALCCIDLPFDAGEDFAHDKPGGQPCHHLSGHACRLHGSLTAQGYAGCARYDCLGAGQRAIAIAAPGSFGALRRLHEAHLMLTAAATLRLPPEAEARRLALLAALDAPGDHDSATLAGFDTGPLPGEVRGFLRGLRSLLSRR